MLLTTHRDGPKHGRHRYGWNFGTPEAKDANLADGRLGDEFGGLAQLVDLKVRRP
jgi:hypothetical protein